MLENLEEKVKKMPSPKVIEGLPKSRLYLTSNESSSPGFTINWQRVLAKISEYLITKNAIKIIELLFLELDYVQMNYNAVEDLRSLVRRPADESVIRAIEAKLNSLKKLVGVYLQDSQTNVPLLNDLIYESSFVVQQLKSLEVVGVGAFMLASGFRLALLQLQVASNHATWSQVESKAIEDSNYAFALTPRLFRLSVGLIDKFCKCIRFESFPEVEQRIIQYECRYFDGKDIHIFRADPPVAEFECNKHRLLMFETVADRVNQTAALPVRTAVKEWRSLAASIKQSSSTTDELADRNVLMNEDG